MFCSKCGQQNSDNGSFCIQCGQSLQMLPSAPEISGKPGSLFSEESTTRSQHASPFPRTDHKGKAGLIIALAISGLVLISALLILFLGVIPILNKESGDRGIETTETVAESAIVGLWSNEDIPSVVKFKMNGDVTIFNQDESITGTYEYDEKEEEGVISLESGDFKFVVSENEIDIDKAGDFIKVDDKDFDIQEFIDDNRTTTTTAAATTAAVETTAAAATAKVGVAMPTKDLQRWYQDGANMKKALEEAGFAVDLQYASNDTATQVSQVENMITGGCTVLVIAAIDGSSLGTVLATAKEANIPVIAYDRLIWDTDAVSYYATFDNYMVGTIQGNYIVDTFKLKDTTSKFNMEIFGGSADDNNARFFYQGAMDVLKPYIDKGTLVVVSGQVEFEKIATAAWKTETAQARMDNLITANYATGTKLDVVLCSNDSTALGVENSLDNAGYVVGENWPVITGQDCDKVNTINMIAGKQSMSVFKDTRTLAAKVVEMVTSIVKGTTVYVNDTKTYDNGKGVVPTFLCTPVFADKSNYKTILIDSGYYKEADLAS